MKKSFLLMALVMMSGATSLFAQKAVVFCDYFVHADDVTLSDCEQVRNAVMSGINAVNRVQLIDVASSDALKLEEERRSSEAAMADNTARTSQMKQMGAQYILYGYVSTCKAVPTKASDGSTMYNGVVSYTVKVVNAENGTVYASHDYTYDGLRSVLGNSPEEAVTSTLKAVGNSMDNFINEHFKLKAVILESDYVAKKKKDVEVEMKECYVTLGSDHGIEKGQRLDAVVIVIIAGRETEKVIGSLTVKEVVAGDLAKCDVTKGGEEIMVAMKEYLDTKATDESNAKPIQVVTKKQSGLKSLGKGALNSLGF